MTKLHLDKAAQQALSVLEQAWQYVQHIGPILGALLVVGTVWLLWEATTKWATYEQREQQALMDAAKEKWAILSGEGR
jgi:hypothetical protein